MKKLFSVLSLLVFFYFLLFIQSCKEEEPTQPQNQKPQIQSLSASPSTIKVNEETTLTCVATDPDGDNLTISWSAPSGTFPNGNVGTSVKWKAPANIGVYSITATVNDGKDIDKDVVSVNVEAGDTTLQPPTLQLPANGATNQSTNSSLIWHESTGATSYTLQVSKAADFSNFLFNIPGITETYYNLSGLESNTTYHWRVNASYSLGNSSWSQVWSFSTLIDESELLLKYFELSNDYIHTSGTFVISASDVRTIQLTNPTSQKLVDIRAAGDFTAGHIEGAVNVPFSNLYDYIKTLNPTAYNRIVIICYSGQTSAYAVSLIRAIGGYNNAISLKWGMSSWDSVFATNYWLAKLSNIRAGSFVTTPFAKNPKGDLPVINTGKTNAPDILEARIKKLLADGYPSATIRNSIVYSNLSNYYIMNYWSPSLYANLGHIYGAINYDPGAQPFKSANDLKTLPTNKTSVLYCSTGQSSSYVGAYLRILGYDVKSLTYGANDMIYDLMLISGVVDTFIPATEIKGYPYVTGN